MAYDAASQRIFIGCRNSMLAVVDALTGKVVAHQQTCSGVDAGAFDPSSKLIFISCSEGVISVIHELTPDNYDLVDTVKTQLWARTMALDPVTKKIHMPTADIETVARARSTETVCKENETWELPSARRVTLIRNGRSRANVKRQPLATSHKPHITAFMRGAQATRSDSRPRHPVAEDDLFNEFQKKMKQRMI
jgi:hypothetical protein